MNELEKLQFIINNEELASGEIYFGKRMIECVNMKQKEQAQLNYFSYKAYLNNVQTHASGMTINSPFNERFEDVYSKLDILIS
jgi:hypothetical protein